MPYVVIFYYEGNELRARIRDVSSQEQRILRDATDLWTLLTSAWRRGAGPSSS